VHRRRETLAGTHARSPTAREAGGPHRVKVRRLSNVSQARERCYSEADACQRIVLTAAPDFTRSLWQSLPRPSGLRGPDASALREKQKCFPWVPAGLDSSRTGNPSLRGDAISLDAISEG
jgi:hypothetical protein